MNRHDLVCAHCNGPVSEGRCATCRRSRQLVSQARFSPEVIVALLTALVAAIALSLAGARAFAMG